MTNIRKSDGYGEQPSPKESETKRPAATYGAPVAATAYGGAHHAHAHGRRHFPWITLVFLCILAVLLVIGLCKYGLKDTVPYVAPPTPTTTVYVPPVPDVDVPLARAG